MPDAAPPAEVVVLTFWDPWEAPHGGTLRTRALCSAFVDAGAERVTCVFPRAPGSREGLVDGVDRRPVTQQTIGHRRWPPVLQRAKRALWPLPTALGARSEHLRRALLDLPSTEVLVVSQLSALQYHEVLPGSRLWLDQSDLWSEFATREAAARPFPTRATASIQARALRRTEARAVGEVDVVTAAGWTDRNLLAERTGANVWWLPTPVTAAEIPRAPRSHEGAVAGLLANFEFHPNLDALEVLDQWWLAPLRAAGWEVVVAGLGSDRVALPEGVRALGPLDEVDQFYEQVDATIAPIRLGGGMKVKVIESLVHERPVIATDFAMDGFPPEIRAVATTVPVEATWLPGPEVVLAAPPLPASARRRFSLDGFTATVREALSSRPEGDAGHR